MSTETNFQRSRRPASEQDVLRTTNIKCLSCDKIVSQFQRSLENVIASHFIVGLACLVMNSGFRSNFPGFLGKQLR